MSSYDSPIPFILAFRPGHSPVAMETDEKVEPEGDKRGEEPAHRSKYGEDARERRERSEEAQRGGERWERRPTSDATDKRRRREDSEPRLFIACDDNQDSQAQTESAEKSGTLMWYPHTSFSL